MVEFMFFSSSKKSNLALSLFGTKPANIKRFVGSPDSCNAEMTAQHPGIVVTFMFCFLHSLTNLYPGSEIKGDPASLTRATSLPSFIMFIYKF